MHRGCLLFFGVLAGAVGCGGGPRAAVMRAVDARDVSGSLDAYDRFRESEGGGDPHLLAEVAALVLEEVARGDAGPERDAALHQIELAGTAGEPVLERLAASAEDEVVRARALGVLVDRGDSGARQALRAMLGTDDAAVLAEAVKVLDADEEREQLLVLLEHTSPDVRAEAARRLAGAAPSGRVRAALAEASRVDPIPSVRATATRVLGGFGPEAYEPLRGRLSDESGSVRMAAVGALLRADRARALLEIGALLETTPNPASIEAARVLAAEGGEEGDTARAFLRRALHDGEANVRAQAAVALSSLGTDGLEASLLGVLRDEPEARVKLSLASILLRCEATREPAREALEALMRSGGMYGVQAATLLAERGGDGQAVRHLARAMREGEPDVRRTAARALARDALEPDMARDALRDEHALVRIYAAGGILAAASAL